MCNAVPLAMKEYGKKLLEDTHEDLNWNQEKKCVSPFPVWVPEIQLRSLGLVTAVSIQ